MVVRIRFRRGPRVERRKGKNSRIAWIAAGLLTLGSVACLVLGLWRLGIDFGWTANFVFPDDSVFSHWQIWFTASLLIQTVAWKLNQYGKPRQIARPDEQPDAKNDKGKMTASA
jgi:hypothetical protein